MRFSFALLFGLSTWTMLSLVSADSITKIDGSQLTGRISHVDDAKVTLIPADKNAEPVEIPLLQTQDFRFDKRTEVPAVKHDSELWDVRLKDGGRILGNLLTISETNVGLKCPAPVDGELTIPRASVVQMVRTTELDRAKGRRVGEEDLLIVNVDDDRRTTLSGSVGALDEEGLKVVYKGRSRNLKVEKLSALFFAPSEAELETSGQVFLLQIAHNRLPVYWQGIADKKLKFRSIWGNEFEVERSHVGLLETRNPNLRFLSSLEPTDVEQTAFFDRIMSWQADRGLDGGPLQVGGKKVRRGLALHAKTKLTFAVPAGFREFRADLALADAALHGNAEIQVLDGDGRVLFERASLTRHDGSIPVRVDLENSRQITLLVDFGAGQDVGDRVIWANARLLKSGE